MNVRISLHNFSITSIRDIATFIVSTILSCVLFYAVLSPRSYVHPRHRGASAFKIVAAYRNYGWDALQATRALVLS